MTPACPALPARTRAALAAWTRGCCDGWRGGRGAGACFLLLTLTELASFLSSPITRVSRWVAAQSGHGSQGHFNLQI